ncbi:hypothetical protein [Dendronalium sp. ChiSLP03b]|uniref:hypothetical protein n=1 Tax=Dendronalium sp. ChiSLP03b TaxID=3075381 RepID=UPI002AD2206D|nr:hypothetical protein [Dendronalium sp. ChiSLP03b]MDZ8203070.1 hypothetical protein [Dendronalium sp. ChiSLP03b]
MPTRILIKVNLILIQLGLTSRKFKIAIAIARGRQKPILLNSGRLWWRSRNAFGF